MKRIMRAGAWLMVIAMMAFAPFFAASLSAEKENPVRKSRTTWTGVLRLWKCEGWQSGNGSLTAWLNACIERFEKRNPGVYIQVKEVAAEAMRSFMNSANPPDMILYAPGMLEAPYSLAVMEEEIPVQQTLQGMGIWQEERYAAPVAMGGYALAVNTKLLPQIPDHWGEMELSQAKGSKQIGVLLNMPADGDYRSWAAAVMAMFAGNYKKGTAAEPVPVGEGVDLGLPAGEPEKMEQSEAETGEVLPNALPAVLPEDFRKQESVYTQFTSGKIAVMPVTQRELRRLQLLSETGKAPDWRVETIGAAFTDQTAMFSVVAWEREDIEARQGLCLEFMRLMLSEEMQKKLTVSRAFSVRGMAALYAGNQGMSAMEAALKSESLLVPPVFGNEWRVYAGDLMDGIGAGEATQEKYGLLEMMLKK